MILFNHILKKYTGEYKLHKSQEKINHLMYMDAIKLLKKWKRIGNTNTGSEYIQSSYRNWICHANKKEKLRTLREKKTNK